MLAEITRPCRRSRKRVAALSLYRFGASRAYYGIVQERIRTLSETRVPGYETIGTFLERRLAAGNAHLSVGRGGGRPTFRASSLRYGSPEKLIDVELERQNERPVEFDGSPRQAAIAPAADRPEGLSVAAISYYVVGLFGYLARPSVMNSR